MKEKLNYEESMRRLEELAQQMERNELSIDVLADKLKEAKELIAYCRKRLYQVDEEITKILDK